MDTTDDRPLPGPGDLLSIDWGRLQELPPADRFRALGDLAETAGAWIADQRATIVEELRAGGYSDADIATRFGVTRAVLAGLGDGPVASLGARPRLLLRTAQILLEHASTPSRVEYLTKAIALLSKKGRPGRDDLAAAARRIAICDDVMDARHRMDQVELATVGRGLSNAAEVAQRAATATGALD